MFSRAFQTLGGKGTMHDRYDAACSWALAGYPDSAFFNLERIVTKQEYSNYSHISTDPDLKSLYTDKRWKPLLELVQGNSEKIVYISNMPLTRELDSIREEDQKYRIQSEEVEKKYGWRSKEVEELWRIIAVKDSINLVKISAILAKYGWPDKSVIGPQGCTTIFLVIQHSDIKTQEKYLPMMREAVKNKNALGSDLALLEDRVALRQGRKQTYGSQIGVNQTTHEYYLSPLEDPDNVDKRRAEVGLEPLAEYVSRWNIKWDVEQYKKDLPAYEKLQWGR